ncbi:MAG: hypothetical protein K2J77_03610 [Oscillospiraceae bacterium]|nr:hypothetical protein [Oscillospiraceae bacterium]
MLEDILKKCYCEENNSDKNSESIKTAVLSRIEEGKPMKRRINKKTLLIPAIAAAVILATTCVAGANGWNLKTAISGLFNEDKNDGSAFFGYNINGIGSKKLDQTFERDGYKINMVGVVADKHTSFLLYDLIIDEDHVFKNDVIEHTYSTEDTAILTVWDNSKSYFKLIDDHLDNNRLPNGNYDFEEFDVTQLDTNNMDIVLEQDGNVYHCAHRYDIKPLSLDGKELAFDLNGLSISFGNNIFVETNVCDTVTIDFDFINDDENVVVEFNQPFTFEDETYTLNTVELTPFSVYLRISQSKEVIESEDMDEFADNSIKIRDDVTLRLKDGLITDGEVLFWDKHTGGNATNENGAMFSNIHLMWKHPVNVDDIEAITIGDTTFTLD